MFFFDIFAFVFNVILILSILFIFYSFFLIIFNMHITFVLNMHIRIYVVDFLLNVRIYLIVFNIFDFVFNTVNFHLNILDFSMGYRKRNVKVIQTYR